MKINKSHFIQELSTRLGETNSRTEQIIETYNKLICELVRQDKVIATGLGQFSRSHRKARIGVNPRQPDQKITISALVTPKFRASETFKNAIKQ